MTNSPRTATIPSPSYRIAVTAYPRDSGTLVSTKFPTTARRPSSCSAPIGRFRLDASATRGDRKSTRLNSSHSQISYAVFCLKKKKKDKKQRLYEYNYNDD